jgi:uncharacterized caspase-like protein
VTNLTENRRDLKINEMRRALRDFVDRARDADVAVVYYAGHGIELDGTNYLIPVDAVLDRDIDIHDEALSLERVLVSVEPAKKLRLVILDACRENQSERSWTRSLQSCKRPDRSFAACKAAGLSDPVAAREAAARGTLARASAPSRMRKCAIDTSRRSGQITRHLFRASAAAGRLPRAKSFRLRSYRNEKGPPPRPLPVNSL